MNSEKIKTKQAKLLYLLGFNKAQIMSLLERSSGWLNKRLHGIRENDRIKFHLQEKVDLNKLYNQYIK